MVIQILSQDTGAKLDVNGRIGLVKEIGGIANITEIKASWTYSIEILTTSKNVRTLSFLGLTGSVSLEPYRITKVSLLVDGAPILRNGTLEITRFSDGKYKANIKAGINDLYNSIQNDKLSDLGLGELNHTKNINNIVDSWGQNSPYVYMVGLYNGPLLSDYTDGALTRTNFDIDAMTPSAKVPYILDKIFNRYGWTYSGLFNADSLMLSYPSGILTSESGGDVLAATFNTNTMLYEPEPQSNGYHQIKYMTGYQHDSEVSASQGILIFDTAGDYDLIMPKLSWIPSQVQISYRFKKNGSFISINPIAVGNDKLKYSFNGMIQNDSIEIGYYVTGQDLNRPYFIRINEIQDFNVILTSFIPVDFSEALTDFSVKDFLKEIMIRTGTTPLIDYDSKHIDFINLNTRTDYVNAKTISRSEVISLESREFKPSEYAQVNRLKLKYNNEEQDFNDSQILVDNELLEQSKDLYNSKTFSQLPDKSEVKLYMPNSNTLTLQLPIYPLFEINVNEIDGVLQAEFNPKDKHFYFSRFSRAVQQGTGIYINGAAYEPQNLPDHLPIADPIDFDSEIQAVYSKFGMLFDRYQKDTFKLRFDASEILNFDLSKVYYIESEAAYYSPLRLVWDSDTGVTLEALKIDVSQEFE